MSEEQAPKVGRSTGFRIALIVVGACLVAGVGLLILKPPSAPSGPAAEERVMPAKADVARIADEASAGKAAAQNQMGEWSLRGEGMRQDSRVAAEWFGKAAAQGLAVAQFNLGAMFEAGQGVPLDYARALEWYRKAAEQGQAQAQYSLASMYVYGRGVPRDDAQALHWLKQAAQRGDVMAEYAMAHRYRTGTGVPVDPVEAFKWFSLAAAQELPDAREALSEIQAKMTAPQVAEGRRRAAAFVPQGSSTNAPR